MAFRSSDGSFLGEWYARKQEEFYSHVPVWVAVGAAACEAAGRQLTHTEYHGLIELLDGMNSHTRKVLLPVLDDLAVCELASYCMNQSGRELGELDIPRHYNEAVEKELAPLLVKRLRESAGLLNMTRKYAEEWGRWRETIEHLKKTAAGQQKRAARLARELEIGQLEDVSFAGAALTALEPAIGDPLKFMPEASLGNRVLAGIEKVMGLLEKAYATLEPVKEELGRAVGRYRQLETELSGAAVLAAAQREEIAQLLLDKTDYLARCVVACHDLKKQLQIAETKLGSEGAELDHARREAAAWEVQCQDLRDKLVQLQATQEAQQKMGAKLADYLDTANGIIEEEGGDEEDIRDARELVAEARVVFGMKVS